MHITVKALITAPPPSGLGYCCEWLFFQKFKRTGIIAERLGVTPRAVKYHKAEAKKGKCEGCTRCMKGR